MGTGAIVTGGCGTSSNPLQFTLLPLDSVEGPLSDPRESLFWSFFDSPLTSHFFSDTVHFALCSSLSSLLSLVSSLLLQSLLLTLSFLQESALAVVFFSVLSSVVVSGDALVSFPFGLVVSTVGSSVSSSSSPRIDPPVEEEMAKAPKVGDSGCVNVDGVSLQAPLLSLLFSSVPESCKP